MKVGSFYQYRETVDVFLAPRVAPATEATRSGVASR